MTELQAVGVEHQAGNLHAFFKTVQFVPADGVLDAPQVYPDLVCPSGQDMYIQKRAARPLRQHFPAGQCRTSVRIHRHFLPVFFAAVYGRIDFAFRLFEPALRQRPVMLFDFPILQHPAELFLGFVVLRYQHQAAGFLIQPMHNAGAQFAADAAQGIQSGQQRVHQCAVRMSHRGMHHHAPGLDHHSQVFILIQDFQRNILRLRHSFLRSGHCQDDFLPCRQLGAGLRAGFPSGNTQAVLHQRSHPAPAQSGLFTQQHIQPPPV